MPDNPQIEGALPPDGGDAPDMRAEALTLLAEGAFDVLVIGGGITGAGVARDAARPRRRALPRARPARARLRGVPRAPHPRHDRAAPRASPAIHVARLRERAHQALEAPRRALSLRHARPRAKSRPAPHAHHVRAERARAGAA